MVDVGGSRRYACTATLDSVEATSASSHVRKREAKHEAARALVDALSKTPSPPPLVRTQCSNVFDLAQPPVLLALYSRREHFSAYTATIVARANVRTHIVFARDPPPLHARTRTLWHRVANDDEARAAFALLLGRLTVFFGDPLALCEERVCVAAHAEHARFVACALNTLDNPRSVEWCNLPPPASSSHSTPH